MALASTNPAFRPPDLADLLPVLMHRSWGLPVLVGGVAWIALLSVWLSLAPGPDRGSLPEASDFLGILGYWLALGRGSGVGPIVFFHPLAALTHGLALMLAVRLGQNALAVREAYAGLAVLKTNPQGDYWAAVARRRCRTSPWVAAAVKANYHTCHTRWKAELQAGYLCLYIVAALLLIPVTISTVLTMTPELAREAFVVRLWLPSAVGMLEAGALSLLFILQEWRWEHLFLQWQVDATSLDDDENEFKQAHSSSSPLGDQASASTNNTSEKDDSQNHQPDDHMVTTPVQLATKPIDSYEETMRTSDDDPPT